MAAAYSQRWGNNVGNSDVTSMTVTVSGATAGSRLTAMLACRHASTAGTITHDSNWTLVSGDDILGFFYERIASGDSNDNITLTVTNARTMGGIVHEYTGLKSTGTYDDYSSAVDNADVLTIDSGNATPTVQPGLAISGLAVRDQQDWRTTYTAGQPDGIYNSSGFTVPWYEMSTLSSATIAALGYKSYSALSALNSVWDTDDTVGCPVASVIALYEEAAADPTINSVTPSTFDDGHTGIVISTSNIVTAGASVFIGGVEQTVTGTTANSITFTAVRGSGNLGDSTLTVVEA